MSNTQPEPLRDAPISIDDNGKPSWRGMCSYKNIKVRSASNLRWAVGICGLLLSCFSLSGCIVTSGAAFGAASGAMEAKGVGNDFKYYLFDVPPQVIYRIDDHRFFTLENYKDCDHGGIVYYHDTNKNIKEYINGGSDSNSILEPNPTLFWKGGVVYAASPNVIAYPEVHHSYSDRELNNGVYLYHSNNGYKMNIYLSTDYYRGDDLTVFINDNDVYLKGSPPFSKHFEVVDYKLPFSGNEDYYDVKIPERAKTPSGAIRFTCDMSIRPTNVSVTPEQVYATDATGIPQYE